MTPVARHPGRVLALASLLVLVASTVHAANKYPPGPSYRPVCASWPDSIDIYSIQQTDTTLAPCHPATLDTVLGVRGIITGFDAKASAYGFYIEKATGGAFTGVDVFTGATNYNSSVPGTPTGGNLAIGDEVKIYGTTQEFPNPNGETEIEGPDAVQATNDILIRRISTGNPLPPWKIATTSEVNWLPAFSQGEMWEGCLVRIRGPLRVGRVAGNGLASGFFLIATVSPSSDSVLVDGTTLATFAAPAVGTVIDSVQGIVNQRTTNGVNSYRLQIRDGNDIFLAAPPSLTDAYSIESNQIQLVFDRNLDPPSAQNAGNYTLGSAGSGSSVISAVMPAIPGNVVILTVSNPSVPVGGFESVTVSGVGAASCPSCIISPPQTLSFVNGVLTCAQIQAPDPAFLPLYNDRSRFAGAGSSAGPRLTFRGIAVHAYGTLYYVADEVPQLRGGVAVFGPTQPLIDGHRYRISAQVQEFGGETEVVGTVQITDEGTDTIPTPRFQSIHALRDTTTDIPQADTTGEDYEGVLVEVSNARVTQNSTIGQNFLIAGPAPGYADTILVSNLNGALNAFTPPDSGSNVNVIGILHFVSGTFRICPRDGGDVQEVGVPVFTFDQLSFDSDSGTVNNADLASCNLSYVPAPTEQFLNVAVRLPGSGIGMWAVRNMYLPDAASAPPVENLSAQFPLYPLGITTGTLLSQVEYGWIISPTPMLDPDSLKWMLGLLWQPAPVSHPVITIGGYIGPSVPVIVHPDSIKIYLPFGPPIVILRSTWIGCHMPNIDLDDGAHPGDKSGCGPAAATNSLRWLETQHPEVGFPSSERSTFLQLSDLMNRLFKKGVTDSEMIVGKLDFIEAHHLPIRVKFQGSGLPDNIASTSGQSHASRQPGASLGLPTNAFLQSEASHGEDIELNGTFRYFDGTEWKIIGGHSVVLSGAGSVNGKPYVVFKDDRYQGIAGGTRQVTTYIDTGQVVIIIPGLGGRTKIGGKDVNYVFWLQGLISESYDPTVTPPPAQVTFTEYCQWFCRTIPPGGKFKLKFPKGSRCFNVTVYEEERSVRPPVIHKVLTWNYGSDSTRTYVNFDTTQCVTVWIHNDDDLRNGATYTPYTIDLTVLPANVAATPTSDNTNWFGGFSAGGADGSSKEFGSPAGPNVTFNASVGCLLSGIPAVMGSGVQQLTLNYPIAAWTPYWSHLELRLAVVSVAHAGNLQITCPSSGFSGAIAIGAPGTYVVDLGTVPQTTNFSLTMATQAGLIFEIDAIGVPSVIPTPADVQGGEPPLVAGLRTIGPNPSRTSFTAEFAMPAPDRVQLAVYDVAGRRMATLASGPMAAGSYRLVWNGRDESGKPAPIGLYFCRLQIAGRTWVNRWVMVR